MSNYFFRIMASKKSKLLGSLAEKNELINVLVGIEHEIPTF